MPDFSWIKKISTPNLITLARLPLLFLVVGLLYTPWPWLLGLDMFLLAVLFLMDWLDGYLARHKNEVSDLGAVLDISLDRVVENVLWVAFAHLGKVGVWVPIVFLTRSFVIDGMRSFALSRGHSAFGMMRSPLGRFLVAGRFMRALYGLAKGLAFGALILTSFIIAQGWAAEPAWAWTFWAERFLVYLSVVLCIVRGVPVLLDARELFALPGTVSGKGGETGTDALPQTENQPREDREA